MAEQITMTFWADIGQNGGFWKLEIGVKDCGTSRNHEL